MTETRYQYRFKAGEKLKLTLNGLRVYLSRNRNGILVEAPVEVLISKCPVDESDKTADTI